MPDSLTGPQSLCPPRGSSRLLLILGAPASGKTHLADRLATRYDLLTLRKDEIKELLFDTLAAADSHAASADPAVWSRALSDASFALLFAFAPRLLHPARTLLLEGNFRPGEHESALAALLECSGARLAQVLCHARADTRAARLTARASDPHRHRGHRDHALAAAADTLDGFLALPGLRLRFDSDAAREPQLQSLSALLDPWMTGDARDQ